MFTDHHFGSFLEFRKQELVVRIQAKLFPVGLWQQLHTWFSGEWSSTWLAQPFQSMFSTGDLPNPPRWKENRLDLLSYLIFCLLVPAQHQLVRLWQQIDWAAVNRLAAPGYQNQRHGQRAWAPAQMVALLLLFVLLPNHSETGLLQQVALVPLYRWFCGCGLFSPLPDHSSLHTFRKRLGAERFEALLSWVIIRCQQAGLISNELLFFDMTGMDASAHRWNSYQRAVLLTHALIRYLEHAQVAPNILLTENLRLQLAQLAIEVQENQSLSNHSEIACRVLRSLQRWTETGTAGQPLWQKAIEAAVIERLAEETLDLPAPFSFQDASVRENLKRVARMLKAHLPHARGDLDARVGWTSDVQMRCGYWLGFLADSLHRVITAVCLVPVNQVEREQLLPALDQHRDRIQAYPQAISTDSGQDYDPVHQGLRQRGVQGQIAARDHRGRGGGWGPRHFRFNELGQLYCPMGKLLQAGKPRKDGLVPYQASANDCAACTCRIQCLPKGQQLKGQRLIHVEPEAHRRWIANLENTRTAAYKGAQAKRFASEGLFGLAKRLHGAEKAPYRSQPMNLIFGLLIGMAMNLAVLTRHSSS
jgi:transposase